MMINIVVAFTSFDAVHTPWLYFLLIQMNYVVIGGIFALFPVPVAKVFGPLYGVRVYSIVLLGSLISSIFDTACIVALYDSWGIK